MGVSREQGSWLGQHYEKVILVLVLGALCFSAIYLVLRIENIRQQVLAEDWTMPPRAPREAKLLELGTYSQALQRLEHPFQSGSYSNQMMVSELRVACVYEDCGKPIPYHASVCPFCGRRQPEAINPNQVDSDGDGMPDKYETVHGLNPFDPADARQDKDGDGFMNIEEFQSRTAPEDAQSYPPLVAKLRLVKIVSHPFKLRFQGVQKLANGSVRFLLNLRTLQKSYFVKMGQVVEQYKVLKYHPRVVTNEFGRKVDLSVLTLQKGSETIDLVKNRALTKYEKTALIILLTDGSRYRKRIGDQIEIKGRKYKVVDIRQGGVLIRDMQTGSESLVGRLSQEEWDQFQAIRRGGRVEAGRPSRLGNSRGAVSSSETRSVSF